jgi:hypothetical protein
MPTNTDWTAMILKELGWQARLAETPDNDHQILWHYTSLESFKKIIESKTIHLNRLDRMNDSEEGKWLSSHIQNRISLGDQVASAALMRIFGAETFAFSLSEEHDLLSQWLAYANGGRGLAIGFDYAKLREACEPPVTTEWKALASAYEPSCAFCRVEYAATERMNDIAGKIAELMRSAQDEVNANRIEQHGAINVSGVPGIGHAYLSVGQQIGRVIRQLNTVYKNHAFHQEKEWRVAFYEGSQFYEDSP